VTPEDLMYTAEHEWARAQGPTGGAAVVRIGITDYAQEQLGDIVFVQIPAAGTPVTGGQPFGEVESTKSVSDLYAPVTGTIVARNDVLDSQPELLNSDPYGEGWMVEIQVEDPTALDSLLDAAAYQDVIDAE
jgi:glycine cleavage system H protein